jgi:hypothetical protein
MLGAGERLRGVANPMTWRRIDMKRSFTLFVLACVVAVACSLVIVRPGECLDRVLTPILRRDVPVLTPIRQAIEIQPAEPVVEPGSTSKPVSIIARLPETAKGTVTINLSGLPAGVTASPAFPVTVTKTGTEGPEMKFNFRLVANRSADPVGLVPVKFTAVVKPITPVNGSLDPITLSRNLNINVHPVSSEFDAYASPRQLDIPRGGNATFSVMVNRWGSESRDVTISLASTPMSGVTISPALGSSTFAPDVSVKTFTMSVSPTANLGSDVLTFGATGIVFAPSTPKTVQFTLNYKTMQPDFSIDIAPSAVSVMQEATSSPVKVTVNKINGYTLPVAVAVSGVPAGVTANVNTDATTGNGTITFTPTDTAVEGTYTLLVVGTGIINGQTVTRSQTLDLTVEELPGSFTMAIPSSSISVEKGSDSGPIQVNITREGSFKGAVDVNLSGLPSGVSCNETLPIRITETQTSCTFTLKVGTTATTGTKTIAVNGTGYPKTSVTASATLNLTVANAKGDFTLSATTTPSPLNIEFRKSGTLSAKIARSGSFTGDVTVDLSGLPTGVTTPATTIKIPAGSDTASFPLTATEASKFETDKTLTLTAKGTVNGSTVTHSATAKVSVLRIMGDFKKVDPSSKSNVTSGDGKFKAAITGNNPYNVAFQKAPPSGSSYWAQIAAMPFAIGPTSNLGGVCFNEASTCGVVLTGKGSGSYGFASDYQYTILWLYGNPVIQQQYQVNVNKGYDNFWPELRFSPDGTLALITAADKFGTANYDINVSDTLQGRIIANLKGNCISGGAVTYPTAKVYLSSGKTKIDVVCDGTTHTYDAP